MNLLAYQPVISGISSANDRRLHVAGIIRFLEEAFRQEGSINLIILPELSTIEYSRAAFNKLPELAEPLFGETFQEMAALARRVECAISYGFPRVEKDTYTISQVVIGPSGEYLTHYDKIHLAHFGASAEKEYFSSGDHLSVFELGGIRLGIIICYDFRFPELTRLLVDDYGVDVIVHPVAFTRDGTYVSWFHFVVSRAMENQIYFLSVNRAGQDWGGSIFCPPWIDGQVQPIVMGQEEEAQLFTVDETVINSTREKYPYRQDRLADYSVLKPIETRKASVSRSTVP